MEMKIPTPPETTETKKNSRKGVEENRESNKMEAKISATKNTK